MAGDVLKQTDYRFVGALSDESEFLDRNNQSCELIKSE